MSGAKNIKISQPVEEFVAQLNGRYHKWVSDDFLIRLILMRIKDQHQANSRAGITNIAYNVGCEIFEQLLEYGCKAGGNGHHVAQDLADKFNKFTDKH